MARRNSRQNHVLTCLAMISTVPPRSRTSVEFLRRIVSVPSLSQVPLPSSSQFAGKSASGVRSSSSPLGKESPHHETSHNNAGIGRDDVELDRLLLLVAVEWLWHRRRVWKLLRSCGLCSGLRRAGLCSRRNDELSDLRLGDRLADLDDDGLSARDRRTGRVARPARSAADVSLTPRVAFPKNRGRRPRCVSSVRDSTRAPPLFCIELTPTTQRPGSSADCRCLAWGG